MAASACHHTTSRLTIFDFFYLCLCEDEEVAGLAETAFILAFGTCWDATGTWGLNQTLGAGAGEAPTQEAI